MIAVALVGLALFLITRPIHGRPDLEPDLLPPRASAPELLIRVVGFAGMPLLAIARHRRRGRRGILAGLLAGALCYGGYILAIEPYLPHFDQDRFPLISNFVFFSVLGAAHGLTLGITAWGLAILAKLVRGGLAERRQT